MTKESTPVDRLDRFMLDPALITIVPPEEVQALVQKSATARAERLADLQARAFKEAAGGNRSK